MVRNNGGKKSRARKANTDMTTAFATGTGPTDRAPSLTGPQRDLGEQLQDIVEAQRMRMMELGQRVAALSMGAGPITPMFAPSQDPITMISRTWEKYRPAMDEGMQRLMNAGSGSFENLRNGWDELSKAMQRALTAMLDGKDIPAAQEGLFNAWLGLSRQMTALMTEGMTNSSAEFVKLRDTWSNFLEDMNQFALGTRGSSSGGSWNVMGVNKSSGQMNKEILGYWENAYGQMFRLQDLWMGQMSDASQGLMSSMLDANQKLTEGLQRNKGFGGSSSAI